MILFRYLSKYPIHKAFKYFIVKKQVFYKWVNREVKKILKAYKV